MQDLILGDSSGLSDQMRRENQWIWAGGWLLIFLQAALVWAYPGGAYGESITWTGSSLIVALLMISGGVYVMTAHRVAKSVSTPSVFGWVLVVGLVLRVATCFSVPAFEDDFYRYLLDGGVTANGLNPYSLVPETLLDEDASLSPELQTLAAEAGLVAERINHPWLKTIYPPISQLAFAVAHWIAPWSLASWRFVLGLADLATLGLLILYLRRQKLSGFLILIYWWNPLLIKETYNSCHMDMLTLPFIVGTMLAVDRKRYTWASILLALATGTKLWPVVLLPLVLRPLLKQPLKLCATGLVFAAITLACALPVRMGGLDDDSGFVRYMASWEMNDGLYMVLLWLAELVPQFGDSHLLARILAALILGGLVLLLIRRDEPGTFSKRALFVVATVFLLSPTQFPWYAMWFLPFLVVLPRLSFLMLTPLLSLYYMRFAFKEAECVHLFDYGVVWLEYLPVYALLFWEWWKSGFRFQVSGVVKQFGS
jgi:hypothetical protein